MGKTSRWVSADWSSRFTLQTIDDEDDDEDEDEDDQAATRLLAPSS